MTADLSASQTSPQREINQDSLYSAVNAVAAAAVEGISTAPDSPSTSGIAPQPQTNSSLVSISTTHNISPSGAPPASSSFWTTQPSSFETICKIINVQPHLLIIPCPQAKNFSQTRLIDYQAFCKLVGINPERVLSKMLYVRVESRYLDTFFVNIESKLQPGSSNKQLLQKDQEKPTASANLSVTSKVIESSSNHFNQDIDNLLDPSEALVELPSQSTSSFDSTLASSASKPKAYVHDTQSLTRNTLSPIPQNPTSYQEFCKSLGDLDPSKVSTFQNFLSFTSSSSNSLPLAYLEHIISKNETPSYDQFCQSNPHLDMDSLATMKSYLVSLVTNSRDFFEQTGVELLDQNVKLENSISSEKMVPDIDKTKTIIDQRKRKYNEIDTPIE